MSSTACWSDVEAAATELAGNHRRFESFAWHDRPDDDHLWAIVYVSNRDSGLLDQSNAAAIERELEPFLEADEPDIFSERHGHWAVGHVDGYAMRVYYQDGSITDVFRKWCELQECLSDYPVLDETDYSNREYEATLENIRQVARRHLIDNPPEDWESKVFSWFWDNNQRAVENRDDQGGCPTDEEVRAALIDLELLDATYCVHVGSQLVFESTSLSKARREYRNLVYLASMGLGLADGRSVTLSTDDEVLEETGT